MIFLQPVQAVEGWGSFPSIVIANPVSISTLVSIALKEQVPKDKVSPAPICAPRVQTLLGGVHEVVSKRGLAVHA